MGYFLVFKEQWLVDKVKAHVGDVRHHGKVIVCTEKYQHKKILKNYCLFK